MTAEEKGRGRAHSLILEGREKLSLSGVVEVQSFDEQQIRLETARGMMEIRGQGLHVAKLQLEVGELLVEGEVDAIEYEDELSGRQGFFARLMGR